MFLANENFPRPSILLMRAAGVDVTSVQENFPGISDDLVLSKASLNNLIILTFDKDYGELIFRYHLHNPPAVIFFREKGQNPVFAGETILLLLRDKSLQFHRSFTVIEKESMRQRHY